MISLQNQVAVVTGASGGIGRAIAAELAKQQVSLCLVDRNEAKLIEQQEKLAQTSFEKYCEANPGDFECRIYED